MKQWHRRARIGCAVIGAFLFASVTSNAQTKKHGDIVINGNGIRGTYYSSGDAIVIQGNNTEIRWYGNTPLLRIKGNNNRVYSDAARVILVDGNNNTVYWKRRYNNRAPRVRKTGSSNWVAISKNAL